MLLNVHSYYSLRYGTLSVSDLVDSIVENGYSEAVLTDINNSSGCLEFVKASQEKGLRALVGMEFKETNVHFIAIAKNEEGFREINELRSACNLEQKPLPKRPVFEQVFVVYPLGKMSLPALRPYEFIGIPPHALNKLVSVPRSYFSRMVVLQSLTFKDAHGFKIHQKLRAVGETKLLSQLQPNDTGHPSDYLIPQNKLLERFEAYPDLIENTRKLLAACSFSFNFKEHKNKKTFTHSTEEDKRLLEKLAWEGFAQRYGSDNQVARARVEKELKIITELNFNAYFLIAWDIIRFSMSKGIYHVGRGSGANSIVSYCIHITDVDPIELDLYFERFLNPKRKSPPDFDIDYSWKDRDLIYHYIFRKYGKRHAALLGTMNTFKDSSIIRELGKIYGLPKVDIDRMVDEPNSPLNTSELCQTVLSYYESIADFPNIRSIHAGGILITEQPITCFVALDLPPKGFPTVQFDMYTAEDVGIDKLDILSQRGIGHIKEAAELILENRGETVDVCDIERFKRDPKINAYLKQGDSIGCFYIESPAMRGLLKKLKCSDYLTLVAASSIIRPGVAKSGMMRAYISRFHDPSSTDYLHPMMEEQLRETFGVMVYQEDVLKIGHHFGGLDLADADVLRRMMSGKGRNRKHLEEIEDKFFGHTKAMGYHPDVAREVWRQIESFAGYSFSKAHSASYAVESYQSLFLKTYYPVEFMVAVINNFGGFYQRWVYINEAKKLGGTIHLPCVNHSKYFTCVYGKDIYLGFVHLRSLEQKLAEDLEKERKRHGPFRSLEDFVLRTSPGIEQLSLLIRIDAFRDLGQNKKNLLWEAHSLLGSKKKEEETTYLFSEPARSYALPQFQTDPIENAYDEMELLGFSVSVSEFELLRSSFRGEVMAKDLIKHVGQMVRMVGNYVTTKPVRTVKGSLMAFGTFLDVNGDFFDTTHFPPSLASYPFKGRGCYLLLGKVVEEFGFPSIEVEKIAKLPIKGNPKAE